MIKDHHRGTSLLFWHLKSPVCNVSSFTVAQRKYPPTLRLRQRYCCDAKQAAALCPSGERRLLPKVDGIVWLPTTEAFATSCLPARRIRCGERNHSQVQAHPIRSNNGDLKRQWRRDTRQRISSASSFAVFEGDSACFYRTLKVKLGTIVCWRKWNFSWPERPLNDDISSGASSVWGHL